MSGATATGSINTGLSAYPQVDQNKYPDIWAEFVRIRNAINLISQSVDLIGRLPAGGNIGQFLLKAGAPDYVANWSDFPGETAGAAATTVFNAGTTVTDTTTFNGYTLAQVVEALHLLKILL